MLARFGNDGRIVTLHPRWFGSHRPAAELHSPHHLTEEFNNGRRLSIDVLQRWGTDLLTAVAALEQAGITHRDIKPSNLAVFQPNQRVDSHLVMFDFSMAEWTPGTLAGTPPTSTVPGDR